MKGIYCTLIARALKMKFKEDSGSFPPPIITELWKIFQNQMRCFLGKTNTQICDFEQNSFDNFP